MTGPYDGILGVDRETIIKRFKTSLPVRFEIAEGRTTLSAVIVEIDEQSKKLSKLIEF